MKSPETLVEKIKTHEKFRAFAYPDPGSALARECRRLNLQRPWGFAPANEIIMTLPPEVQAMSGHPWTIGYGETSDVLPDMRVTEEQAHTKLRRRVEYFESEVLRACTVEPNQNQLMALTSFTYNVGVGGLRKSTVLKAHNRRDFAAAARAFALWNKSGGQVLGGLVARRAEEAALYSKPVATPKAETYPPQHEDPPSRKIDPERPMTKSTINRASVAAGGTAAVATIAETARTIADAKTTLDVFGEWTMPVLLALIVALCGYIVWQRVLQREGGWC